MIDEPRSGRLIQSVIPSHPRLPRKPSRAACSSRPAHTERDHPEKSRSRATALTRPARICGARNPSKPILNVPVIERERSIIFPQGTRNQTAARKPSPSNLRSKRLSGSELTSINQFPKAKLPAIIQQMLPGRKISGHEYIVRNPKRVDKRVGSFKICVWGLKAGVWSDFAANVKGGDSISLVVYLTSLIAGHRHFAFPCTSPHLPTQEHPISKHTVYTKGGAMAAEDQKTRGP
jgi:hypothetical protein